MNTLATLSTSLLLALPIAAQPATAVAYGTSCYGLTLTSTLPVLGSHMDLTTSGVPVGAQTFTGLGLARTIAPGPFLPLPWDPNACRLHVVPSVSYPALPLGAQTVTLFLVIPNNPALLGFLFYAQSFTMSSTPWLSSNGIEARAGFWDEAIHTALLTQQFYIQAYALAPGAKATQVVTSNGIAWTIGNQ